MNRYEEVEMWALKNGGIEAVRKALAEGRFGYGRKAVIESWLSDQDAKGRDAQAERAAQVTERAAVAAESQATSAERAVWISGIALAISVVALLVSIAGLFKS